MKEDRIAVGRRWRAVVGAALALALSGAATAKPDESSDPPGTPREQALKSLVDRMIVPNGVVSMSLSPDGRKLAMITWTASQRKATSFESPNVTTVLVMDVASGEATPIVGAASRHATELASYGHPLSVLWVADDRVAVNFSSGTCHIYDLAGEDVHVLGSHLLRVVRGGEGKDDIGIVGSAGLFRNLALRRVNLRTGEVQRIPVELSDDVISVTFDARGRLRAAVTAETHWYKAGGQFTTWYRHDEASPWQVLQRKGLEEGWQIVAVPDESDTIVIASRDGRETWALFDYDTTARQVKELQMGSPDEDIVAVSEDSRADVQRAVTNGLKPTTFWFDETWQRIQRAVDKALPDAVNELSGQAKGNVLIHTRSDRDPGRWLVLDTQRMHMKAVGSNLIGLDRTAMRPMETLTYTTADGFRIPAYLTRPAGPAKPQPLVVLVHGGPVARDHWGWDETVQLLAGAGYAVLQPQFRGSKGFGKSFEMAGYRQWGLAMQDDITAGVKAMIDRGVADPQRICIYGASYGGYAALWGLAKTPELYRCGISLAGVSDIGEMFSDYSDVNRSKLGPEEMRFMIGDVDTMRPQFDSVSPEKHADRIKAPVLLGHGERDGRVPIEHAKRMARALEAAHGQVEYHWYPGEGHGLVYQANRIDFDLAVLNFLDRNIGPTSPLADRWATGMASAAAASGASAPKESPAGGVVAGR
jgi:dipeptidyl aminopeptidase/acylaminoacyl peptidase